MKTITCLYLLLIWTTAWSEDQLISYAEVPAQVSFQSVTELPIQKPSQKVPYGEDPLQFGWLWPTPDTDQTKPLVVVVHGGCWLSAFGVDHSFPMATALVQAGHPVWSLEYRRTGDPGGGWPGTFADIKLAISSIEQLQAHGVNTEQVILMGHSAGGHLALLAASEIPTVQFQQVIGLAAITDISRYALGSNSCQMAGPLFMNGLPHEQPKAYQNANLIYRNLPQTVLLLQGDADRIVPVLQSQLHEVKAEVLPEAGHFDWIHPGTPAFKRLLEVLKP